MIFQIYSVKLGFRKGALSMERKKKIPIGIENFKKIRRENFYYIDKTNMIKDLLYKWSEVNLFTRPRRFGKSLNMNMLKCFFEIGSDSSLFNGMNIVQEKELCAEYMGKFPVISITLKGVSGKNYETAHAMMCEVIGNEALRFQTLLQSERLSEIEKKRYKALIKVNENGSFVMVEEMLINSLLTLSSLLYKHYGTQVILLVDEYDAPLDRAYQSGYYDEMLDLIRNMFHQVLKSNDSLFFSVLTGCLRIAKESIFTGLNNPKVFSVTSVRFDEYFGFTDKEVRDLLEYYGLSEAYSSVKEWYDGYQFGNAGVYCPWDVMNYCDELCADREAKPQEYWINTSSNYIVRRFIHKASKSVQKEIERLIEGESVLKKVQQNLTYHELD